MTEIEYGSGPELPRASTWAMSGITFAASMLIVIGSFQILAGLAAIINDEFFIKTQHYAFNLDVTAWGWIHLILGVLLIVTGSALFANKTWAGVTAIGLAILSAIENFFFIPYYPWWSVLIIALDVWVLWALTRPGAIRT
jgi:hypothetical protein